MWCRRLCSRANSPFTPPPFHLNCAPLLFVRVQNVEYEFHPEYWGHVSPEAKELVSRMLTKDTKARVTAAEALAHPWVRLAPI